MKSVVFEPRPTLSCPSPCSSERWKLPSCLVQTRTQDSLSSQIPAIRLSPADLLLRPSLRRGHLRRGGCLLLRPYWWDWCSAWSVAGPRIPDPSLSLGKLMGKEFPPGLASQGGLGLWSPDPLSTQLLEWGCHSERSTSS